jgi:hypothetical protein
MNAHNIQGRSVARRMINVVGANSIHGSVRSSKLRATTWARPLNYGIGTGLWARGIAFLDIHSSMSELIHHPYASLFKRSDIQKVIIVT